MTNKLNLKLFFFLLPVSCLASGKNETELQPTGGPLQITGIREKLSSAAPASSQNTSEIEHGQPSQGNGTSGNFYNVKRRETNPSAGNESLAGTESPPGTSFSEIKISLEPVTPSSAPTLSSRGNGQNTTNSAPIVRTTGPMVIDNHSTLRTTVKPMLMSSTEIKTSLNHQPTKPHSTQTVTKVGPTAEPRRENFASQCLIAIGILAAITTIFIMTTVILATKLSGSRHRVSTGQEKEMICISTLMNDSDHPMPTPRHPKSNGALIPITEDEDGDDLTLNSFLHDTEGVA